MESGCAFYLVPNEEGGVDGCRCTRVYGMIGMGAVRFE